MEFPRGWHPHFSTGQRSADGPPYATRRFRSNPRMISLDTIKLVLTLVSGICWTIVYIDGIRLGFKHRSYAIPFYALALNFSWELIYTYYGFSTTISAQAVV